MLALGSAPSPPRKPDTAAVDACDNAANDVFSRDPRTCAGHRVPVSCCNSGAHLRTGSTWVSVGSGALAREQREAHHRRGAARQGSGAPRRGRGVAAHDRGPVGQRLEHHEHEARCWHASSVATARHWRETEEKNKKRKNTSEWEQALHCRSRSRDPRKRPPLHA